MKITKSPWSIDSLRAIFKTPPRAQSSRGYNVVVAPAFKDYPPLLARPLPCSHCGRVGGTLYKRDTIEGKRYEHKQCVPLRGVQ